MPPPEDEQAAAEEAHRAEGQRITEEIKRRITPQLQEMGVTGCMVVGYMTLGDGSKTRFLFVSDGGDPAVKDGLRAPAFASAVWAGLIPSPNIHDQR